MPAAGVLLGAVAIAGLSSSVTPSSGQQPSAPIVTRAAAGADPAGSATPPPPAAPPEPLTAPAAQVRPPADQVRKDPSAKQGKPERPQAGKGKAGNRGR